MNKKNIILLLILVLIVGILSGCQKEIKAPEGVDQEFYDDMVLILEKLEKTKGELDTDNGEKELEEYLENKLWLQPKEVAIVEAIDDLHFWVWFYNDAKEDIELSDELSLKDKIRTVSELMELEIDSSDFIIK